MNELEAALAATRSPDTAVENQQLATIEDQIAELDIDVASVEDRIKAWRTAIADAQSYIRDQRKRRVVLRRKRAIFAKAAFDLREVDRA